VRWHAHPGHAVHLSCFTAGSLLRNRLQYVAEFGHQNESDTRSWSTFWHVLNLIATREARHTSVSVGDAPGMECVQADAATPPQFQIRKTVRIAEDSCGRGADSPDPLRSPPWAPDPDLDSLPDVRRKQHPLIAVGQLRVTELNCAEIFLGRPLRPPEAAREVLSSIQHHHGYDAEGVYVGCPPMALAGDPRHGSAPQPVGLLRVTGGTVATHAYSAERTAAPLSSALLGATTLSSASTALQTVTTPNPALSLSRLSQVRQ
jgi:hypothetical protein